MNLDSKALVIENGENSRRFLRFAWAVLTEV